MNRENGVDGVAKKATPYLLVTEKELIEIINKSGCKKLVIHVEFESDKQREGSDTGDTE